MTCLVIQQGLATAIKANLEGQLELQVSALKSTGKWKFWFVQSSNEQSSVFESNGKFVTYDQNCKRHIRTILVN